MQIIENMNEIQQKITYIIANDLADDPYAQKKFSIKFQQQLDTFNSNITEQKKYEILSNLKKQIENRYLEEIPLIIANLADKKTRERRQSYFGIFLLILSDDLILNNNTKLSKQQVVNYVVEIDKIIENILNDTKILSQYISDKINKSLLYIFINNGFSNKIAHQIIAEIHNIILTRHRANK